MARLLNANRVLTGGAIVLVTTTLTGAMGVLYTFAVARLLDAPEYAALVSLLSILGLASLPAATLQTVVARFVAIATADPGERAGTGLRADGRPSTATHPGVSIATGAGADTSPDAHQTAAQHATAARAIVGGVLRGVVPVALAVTAAVALLSLPLASFLHLKSPLPALVLAPTLGLALLVPLLRGAAQGLHAFGVLAGLLLLESLFKVAGGAAMAWAGFGAAGVLTALLAGSVACLALGWRWLNRLASQPRPATRVSTDLTARTTPHYSDLRDLWRFSIPALLANGGLFAMVVLDTVLVQHYFSAADAAAFAALSVTGRSLFWASGAVTLVLLPIVARQTATNTANRGPRDTKHAPVGAATTAPDEARDTGLMRDTGRRSLLLALALAGALVAVGELAFLAAPHLILSLLFGDAYLAAAPLLPLYGAGTAALALANVALYYLLGRGRAIAGPIATLCALAQVGAVVLWHADLPQVVTALVTADVTVLILALLPAVWTPSRRVSIPAATNA